jgi:hypothetical protein
MRDIPIKINGAKGIIKTARRPGSHGWKHQKGNLFFPKKYKGKLEGLRGWHECEIDFGKDGKFKGKINLQHFFEKITQIYFRDAAYEIIT